ncbi:hypothetical protein, conserved in T. vivax [Trypanosoma vivax Y486]|uniref:Uncharacterized protein n=1 Tax=Trypanosoma vivax (strain Y486) TaxID=1055687 RepID=F9WL16_TRYVY|nr:hypothetical protein, conserved in T. vivax [Trypanosoma vivax Y486]|eukprot:CCD18201.1 hypothetical protein, conserved in T. vivax [Trypanosoma vivax Y486]
MSTKCLILVLLIVLVSQQAAAHRLFCEKFSRILNDNETCAWKHLLLGWANVSNMIALRSEEVLLAAVSVQHRADEAQGNSTAAIKDYGHLLSTLEKCPTQASMYSRISRAIANANTAIAQAQTSQTKAKRAQSEAMDSQKAAINSLFYVSLAGYRFGRHPGVTSYSLLYNELERIQTNSDCANERNISESLNNHANKLNTKTNSTEWKYEMIRLLNSTYESETLKACRMVWNYNKEKLQHMIAAAQNALGKFFSAVLNYNSANFELDNAEQILGNAITDLKGVRTNLMTSFTNDGNELCDMLARGANVKNKLDTADQQLKELRVSFVELNQRTSNVQGDVIATDRKISGGIEKVNAVMRVSFPSLSAKWKYSQNVSNAIRSLSIAKKVMKSAALLHVQTETNVVEAELLAKHGNDLLKQLKTQLSLALGDAHLGAAKIDAAHCKHRVSEILKNFPNTNLTPAIMLNKTALLAVRTAFSHLDGKVGEMESRLVESKRNLQDSSEKIISATEFVIQSKTYAKNAVTEALRDVTRELCGTLRNLSMLRLNINSLGRTAHEMKMNFSVLEKQACVMQQKMHETIEKMPSVSQFLEAPHMKLALVKQLIRSAGQRHTVVLKEISNFLLGGAEFVKRIDESFRTFLQSATTLPRNGPSDLPLSVCDADYLLSKYGLEDVNAFALLKGLNNVDGLRSVSEGIKLNVNKMRSTFKKAVYYLHKANRGLEDVIKMGREDAERSVCVPLHEQLINALCASW